MILGIEQHASQSVSPNDHAEVEMQISCGDLMLLAGGWGHAVLSSDQLVASAVVREEQVVLVGESQFAGWRRHIPVLGTRRVGILSRLHDTTGFPESAGPPSGLVIPSRT